MKKALRKLAHAKINLWLRVLGRREDGFHEIRTRMVEIDLADELDIAITDEPGVELTCTEPDVPVDESNLVMKAVRLLEGEVGRSFGLSLRLRKNIPHGAGLGGGSSDAAAALQGINEMLGLGLERERLSALGSRIGSDVAFFVLGGACDCAGRGEVVVSVPRPAEPLRLLLVKPPFAVATPWAYKQWKDSVEVRGMSYAPQVLPWGELVNDLERPVFAKHLVLGYLKGWLRAQPGVKAALMSGSGSTVFAILDPGMPASELVSRVRAEFGETFWTFLTETISG